MKKVYLFIALFAAVSTACNKTDLEPVNNGDEPKTEVKMITETVTGGKAVSKATIANSDASFKWTIGDNIAVHVSNGDSHKYVFTSDAGASGASAAAASASFTVVYPEGYSRDAFALFPSTIVSENATNYGQEGHTLDVTLPSNYTLAQVSGETSPGPMVATNTAGSGWDFYQLCGLLRLTVTDIPSTAKRLEIDFDGNKVWGDFSIASTVNPGASVIATTADAKHDIITITKDGTNTTFGETSLVLNIPLPTGDYSNISVVAYDALSGGAALKYGNLVFSYTAKNTKAARRTVALNTTCFDLALASFNENEDAYIYQSNPGTPTSNTITIADGKKVILTGVNMLAENTNAIVCEGNAEIVLVGTNTVRSQSQASGTLNYAVIKAGTYEPTKSTLTISGDGILNASPYYPSGATNPNHNGAVIGADYEGGCGNIVINTGTITVSNNYGAAIGSGRVSNGTSKSGSITINGGTINATGSTGAGIGSGGRISKGTGTTSCDGITINGGTVTARSVGGAAIGAGKCEGGGTNSNSYCGNILITGGIIDAKTTNTGDYAGAAIGGGYHSKAGTITISGGTVNAVGSRNSAGIGAGGRNSQCGNILINGGSVDAQGGYGNYEGAGIGTGRGSANNAKSICGTITITNGVTIVKAKNAYGSATKMSVGKGSFSYTQCGTVKINDETGEKSGASQYIYQPGA